jgi:hypothetical protein
MSSEEIPKWKYFVPFYGIFVTYKSQENPKGKWWAASIIMTILALSVIGGGDKNEKNNGPEVAASTGSAEEAKADTTLPKIGEMVKTDNFEITATKLGERKSVGGAYLSQSASEGAIYITIQYQYKNISGKPQGSFSLPSNLKLVGPDGIKYDEDSGASTYFTTELKLDAKILSDLNPGITSKDAGVFEIAKDSWSKPGWQLIIDADDDVVYQLK